MPKIVVVGSANTDMLIRSAHLPQPGETVMGGEFMPAAGGKGANQAVAAARLGAAVSFVACLGDDELGRQALAGYQAAGIDCSYISRISGVASGVALIMVDAQGENMISVAPGANAHLNPTLVERAEAAIAGADMLLTQLEIPLETVAAALRLAHKHGVPAILNPAPARPLPAELLQGVTLTPNQGEAALLCNQQSGEAAELAAQLLAMGAQQVLLTRGARGAYYAGPVGSGEIAAFSVAAVDTTAAGDACNAGLALALARGEPLPAASRYACAVAALATTRSGAQPSLPTAAEVLQLLTQ
jgi:ribokinase